MSRRLLIPLAVLLALVACRAAVAQTPAEAVVLFTTIGGMAPLTSELAIRSDGTVLVGSIGKATPCPHLLPPARLETLRASLQSQRELFGTASVAYGGWADADDITFQLPAPPAPGSSREVTIPTALFPVRLVPLLELIDALGSQACGSRYVRVAPLVR